jgi:hypothetical protein
MVKYAGPDEPAETAGITSPQGTRTLAGGRPLFAATQSTAMCSSARNFSRSASEKEFGMNRTAPWPMPEFPWSC